MNTLILSFQGGDSYNKQKQISSIILQEELKGNDVDYKEITLNSLEENIAPDRRIIILREDKDFLKFDKIIKSEYPQLSEQIEIIPELFCRLKEAMIPQNTVNRVIGNVPHLNRVIPLEFPFSSDYFIRNKPDNLCKDFLLIVDPIIGLWFPFIEDIVKYLEGVAEIFKDSTSSKIEQMDLNKFMDNSVIVYSPTANPHVENIRHTLKNFASTGALNTYKIASEIYKDLKENKIELNRERKDKFVKDNENIPMVVQGILLNLEQMESHVANTIISDADRRQKRETTLSKISKALGIDKDIETGFEAIRKAGGSAILDPIAAAFKSAKEKNDLNKIDKDRGTQISAFLSHDKCESLFKGLFKNFRPGLFKKV